MGRSGIQEAHDRFCPNAEYTKTEKAGTAIAFASPDGAVLGPIPEPAASALLGRWGDGWVATSWEGATVWIRAADLHLSLADLAPEVAPQVIYHVVNQPPQPTLTSDERAAALVREFGPSDITGGDALKAHQAREDAYAAGQAARPLPVPPPLTSEDLPCHCP